ncbi:hypothetical protein WMF37_44660 [Sorangium sp. So ce291]|uniref:hypothetical protein n=1 Tax=Sorangium sp. So ce291 TaxID=3133294 RepID=UPI003F60F6C0
MAATLSTWGLEKLLDGYGVEMKSDAGLDWSRSMTIPVTAQAGKTLWLRMPGVLQLGQAHSSVSEAEWTLDASFGSFHGLGETAFPFP